MRPPADFQIIHFPLYTVHIIKSETDFQLSDNRQFPDK